MDVNNSARMSVWVPQSTSGRKNKLIQYIVQTGTYLVTQSCFGKIPVSRDTSSEGLDGLRFFFKD